MNSEVADESGFALRRLLGVPRRVVYILLAVLVTVAVVVAAILLLLRPGRKWRSLDGSANTDEGQQLVLVESSRVLKGRPAEAPEQLLVLPLEGPIGVATAAARDDNDPLEGGGAIPRRQNHQNALP